MEVETFHNEEKRKKKKKREDGKAKKAAELQNYEGVVENRTKNNETGAAATTVPLMEGSSATISNSNTTTGEDGSGINASMFDYCVENHLSAMDLIYKLCGQEKNAGLLDFEIERLASTITFLREWRYFNYNPRKIRFVSETGCLNEIEAHNEITLSQFSAAIVPKCDVMADAEKVSGPVSSVDSRNDFVLYAGGLIWSLDWCPQMDEGTNSGAKCEFIAVAAHPPDSTNHKIGAPLSGRGMIQIWCLLNYTTKAEMLAPVESTKRRYQKSKVAKKEDNEPVRPRGRPRKNAIEKPLASNPEGQITQALVVHLPEDTTEVLPADKTMLSSHPSLQISTPVSNMKEKHQSNSVSKEVSKQMKPRGKATKFSTNNHSTEDPEGQFIPALAVQLPEHTLNVPRVDESIVSDPAPRKRKERKRKAVYDEKITTDGIASISNSEGQCIQAPSIGFPVSMINRSPTEDNIPGTLEETGKQPARKRVLAADMDCTLAVFRRRSKNKSKICNNLDHDNSGLLTQKLDKGPSLASLEENFKQKDNLVSEVNMCENVTQKDNLVSEVNMRESTSNLGSGGGHVLKDVVLPRVVLCLGHDGKVAWDVKWRPLNADTPVDKHRMGYLAVVLGNGSLEVWEIPSPQVLNCVYASQHGKGTDPRFAKLKPVFRCSMLKYGDGQSMPLTVEWSTTPPHDLILGGCHDGVVALWKFSADFLAEDVRPLLCFSAETGPIRALTWAPYQSNPESSNIIVTAGHGGLKFWDLRDPFRPLWDANPSQRFIYGLDWAPDPRCVLVSYDDGTLRMLSLSRAAYDVPVTGQPFNGTQQQGLHSYYCSSFAVWSIHISRLTGMVAYCCADGTVLYFQLTHKAVDKDPLRNRAPHFLCGSLSSEEPAVIMNTQLPSSPHRMKKSANEWANTPRPARTVVSGLNQSKRTRKGTEKSQKPDDQVLALCYGDDTGNGDTNGSQLSSRGGKGKTSKSRNANGNQALICVDGDEENTNAKEELKEEAGGRIEILPPKIVSMYRVRWNMNKGSERWLCYGGAAGIVRCQEIVAPEFDKKLLRRCNNL